MCWDYSQMQINGQGEYCGACIVYDDKEILHPAWSNMPPLISWILLNRTRPDQNHFKLIGCLYLHNFSTSHMSDRKDWSYLSGGEQYFHIIVLMTYYTATYTYTQHITFITFWRMCIFLVLYLIYAVKEIYIKHSVNRPYSTIIC